MMYGSIPFTGFEFRSSVTAIIDPTSKAVPTICGVKIDEKLYGMKIVNCKLDEIQHFYLHNYHK